MLFQIRRCRFGSLLDCLLQLTFPSLLRRYLICPQHPAALVFPRTMPEAAPRKVPDICNLQDVTLAPPVESLASSPQL